MATEWQNPGPNQQTCAACGRSCLVRVVVTEATCASEMGAGNTRAVCAACWKEGK